MESVQPCLEKRCVAPSLAVDGFAAAVCVRLLAIVTLVAPCVATASPSFNREIRRILLRNCFTCHGPDAKDKESRFRLDTAEHAYADLSEYAGIVPGEPARVDSRRRAVRGALVFDSLARRGCGPHNAIDDSVLAALDQFPRLKRVWLWGTHVTREAAESRPYAIKSAN